MIYAGLRIEHYTDVTISTPMKAVANEIFTVRRIHDQVKTSDYDRQHEKHVRQTYFEKTKYFKDETERYIAESKDKINKV